MEWSQSIAPRYNKLVMHFEINDVEFAEQSVARRMQGETWSFFDRLC